MFCWWWWDMPRMDCCAAPESTGPQVHPKLQPKLQRQADPQTLHHCSHPQEPSQRVLPQLLLLLLLSKLLLPLALRLQRLAQMLLLPLLPLWWAQTLRVHRLRDRRAAQCVSTTLASPAAPAADRPPQPAINNQLHVNTQPEINSRLSTKTQWCRGEQQHERDNRVKGNICCFCVCCLIYELATNSRLHVNTQQRYTLTDQSLQPTADYASTHSDALT